MRDLSRGKPGRPRPVTRGSGFTSSHPIPRKQVGTDPGRHFTPETTHLPANPNPVVDLEPFGKREVWAT